MKLKIAAAAAAAGITMSTVGYASASALSINGGVMQYGEGLVTGCDADGLVAEWVANPTAGVVGFNVNGIAEACVGKTLSVNVAGAEYQRQITSSGSEFFSFNGTPPDAAAVKMWIAG